MNIALQYVYDKNKDLLLPFKNITYKCENCDKPFLSNTSRLPKPKLNNYKILCRECSLCNKIFKIRNILNICNNKIVYQSKQELDLINFCNKNNILIENVPKLKYYFENKTRTYSVDFFIPSLKILIELKDYHIWHKNEVIYGKWACKEKAATEYCEINNLKYELVFKENLDKFLINLSK